MLCAVGAVVGLEYNRQLTEQTMFECKLKTGLKKILPALANPTHFVVKMTGMKFGVWSYFAYRTLTQRTLRTDNVRDFWELICLISCWYLWIRGIWKQKNSSARGRR